MVTTSRERRLVETFVTLADTLVDDYDVVDLLQQLVERCTELFDASAAGIVLTDLNGELEVIASSDEDTRLIELLQLSSGNGPCIEAFQTGETVAVPDVLLVPAGWSDFRERALQLGFASAHSVPMRLRARTIGSLNVFRSDSGRLGSEDALSLRALADVATIGILHQRALAESDVIRAQLQRALDSRIVIEQAKGVIAYTKQVDVDEAFTILRRYARSTSTALTTVAEKVIRFELQL